jgi:superfamily II DNA or RNA helicase
MSDIHFEQTDNVWARIRCDDSTAKELSEFFTFAVPQAKFRKKEAKKYWDGKIRLFSERTHKILAGLEGYVRQFAKDNNYTYSSTLLKGNIAELPAKDYVARWKIPEKMSPRDYQWVAYLWSLTRKRGIVISPTASGKSLIIYMISRWLLEHGKKRGLLIVPTTSLVEQMYSDFAEYGWDVEKNCQRIYEGFTRDAYAPMVISTWQSVFDLPKKYFSQFDFVIGDEAHQFKADSLKSIMTQLVNCDYRIGTTGTLDGSKVHKLVLEGLFGNVQRVASTKELQDKGYLAHLDIKCLVLQHSDIPQSVKGASYPDEIAYLCACESRNRYITNLVKSLDGNTLVLYNYVDKHGRILYDLIKEKLPDRKVHFIHGLVETEDRETVRKLTENESDSVIVASYGTFSTGINIKHLHNVVFASPTKSQIRTLQSIGRGLRLGERKQKCTLYDIVDDMRYGTHVNFALRHYEERIRIYNEEKFNIKTFNIGLR